jgi:hypothetical protein
MHVRNNSDMYLITLAYMDTSTYTVGDSQLDFVAQVVRSLYLNTSRGRLYKKVIKVNYS